jgi:hypothetical protein
VLVRGGVKDHSGANALENAVQTIRKTDISDAGCGGLHCWLMAKVLCRRHTNDGSKGLLFNEVMTTDPLGIFLLCENRLLREALLRILSKRGNLQVVGACAYSPTVLTEVATSRPQVILLDSIGLAVGPITATTPYSQKHSRGTNAHGGNGKQGG